MTSLLRRGRDRLVLGGVRRRAEVLDRPEDVLRFWFGRLPGPKFGRVDAAWLPSRIPCWGGHWARKLVDVDGIIGEYFAETHRLATEGALAHWEDTTEGRLALIIVLDQLSRNLFRGTGAAFAQDEQTLPIVERALALGDDRAFNPLARTLFYLPLMHHEDLKLLDRCVTRYERAHAEARGIPRLVLTVELKSAHRHQEIVHRFGRYPHRNNALGRESTPEEREFLREPFSSF